MASGLTESNVRRRFGENSGFRCGDAVVPTATDLSRLSRKRFAFDLSANDDDDDVDTVDSASVLSIDDRRKWIDLSKFGNVFSHEGSSLFLRIGALVFGLGNLVYYAVELRHVLQPRDHCLEKYTYGWSFIPRLVFVIVQTFFLFKGSKVHIVKHEAVAWFGLMHVMSTNICLWFRTLIFEIMEEFAHHGASVLDASDNSSHWGLETSHTSVASVPGAREHAAALLGGHENSLITSSASPHASPDACNELLLFVSKYLFPLVLEYSIIAIGTFVTIMHSGIRRDDNGNLAQGFQNLIKVSALNVILSSDTDPTSPSDSESNESKTFAKSHVGLFFGVIIIAVALVSIVMFHIYNDELSSVVIFQVADICLHLSFLIACVMAFWLTNPLAHIDKPISVDDLMLLISMIGSVVFEIAVIVPTVEAISRNDDKHYIIDVLQLTCSILALVQNVCQAMLILFALRRYPATKEHVTKMPGRGWFAFLLIGSIGSWLLRSFLGKSVNMATPSGFYGDVPWLLIMNINYPLLLFFRFHSSVCIADIWHVAYTPIHRKLPKICHQRPPMRRSSGDGGVALGVHVMGGRVNEAGPEVGENDNSGGGYVDLPAIMITAPESPDSVFEAAGGTTESVA
jgi:hypothetical protein